MTPLAKYIWLIQLLQKAEMTFEEINNNWLRDRRNTEDENIPLLKRTFHNHIKAIREEYGIHIVCGRGYRYYIEDSDKDVAPKVELLSVLNMLSNTVAEGNLNKSLFVEDYFDIFKNKKVMKFMDAIKTKRKVRYRVDIGLKKPNDIYRVLTVAPYQLHYICSRWYIIGHTDEFGLMRIPLIHHLTTITLSNETFNYPDDYSVESYRKILYGKREMNIHVSIGFKSFAIPDDYFNQFPLMPFQKNIEYKLWSVSGPIKKFYPSHYPVIHLEMPKSAFALYTLKNKLKKYNNYEIMNDIDPFQLFTEEEYNDAMSNPTVL